MGSPNISFDDVGAHVLSESWHRSPMVFRSVLSKAFLSDFNADRFLGWTTHTQGAVRLFQSFENGASRSGLWNEPRMVRESYERLAKSKAAFTIHMNDVELVDQEIFDLRQRINIPYWWRIDDVIGTLSSRGSGIGYHAGHEDGFIVQLVGSRRWKVWSDDCTPTGYRKELLAPSPGPNPSISRPISVECLLLDITLNSGDVLYIPPFFPHEGTTLETSLSLSMAWKGLGPVSFIPPSLYKSFWRHGDLKGEATAVRLFQECDTAKIALMHWEDETLRVVPKSKRKEAQPLIRAAINAHILSLCERYCSTL